MVSSLHLSQTFVVLQSLVFVAIASFCTHSLGVHSLFCPFPPVLESKYTQQTTFLLHRKAGSGTFPQMYFLFLSNDKDICISANSTPLHSDSVHEQKGYLVSLWEICFS